MNINDFYIKYCDKPDICWQLDMGFNEGFSEEEMLAVCIKCIYFERSDNK